MSPTPDIGRNNMLTCCQFHYEKRRTLCAQSGTNSMFLRGMTYICMHVLREQMPRTTRGSAREQNLSHLVECSDKSRVPEATASVATTSDGPGTPAA